MKAEQIETEATKMIRKKQIRRAICKEKMREFKESGEEFFYFLRDRETNIRFGGVCLKQLKNGVWCRGITLLSEHDRFDRDICKEQAHKRLVHAVFGEKNDFPVDFGIGRSSAEKLLRNYPTFLIDNTKIFKSGYDVYLTESEKMMVDCAESKVDGPF